MTVLTKIDPELVTQLSLALEQGDDEGATELLDQLTAIRETELYQQLNELSNNLHDTLDGLGQDAPLLVQAKYELPDVGERLNYVMTETQQASETTLNSAENALSAIQEAQNQLEETALTQLLEQATHELMNIIMAQSYQDLTGQVLTRTGFVLTELEMSLKALIDRSGHDFEAIAEPELSEEERLRREQKGMGPNVTQSSQSDSVGSQADVDDLLSDLGI